MVVSLVTPHTSPPPPPPEEKKGIRGENVDPNARMRAETDGGDDGYFGAWNSSY